MSPPCLAPRRILVIDDTATIHDDFRRIFAPEGGDAKRRLLEAAAELGLEDLDSPSLAQTSFELESAYQGQDGVQLADTRRREGRPFALAFVDMRMPPGWDGLTTSERLWQCDPDLQIVICTAFSDHSWSTICERLQRPDSLLILKKPFDVMEALQLANALTEKWLLRRLERQRVDELEVRVRERTAELETANGELRATGNRLREEVSRRALMERQLQEAKRLEALGRIAASVGHEINNPLSVIITNLNMVREDLDPIAPGLPADTRENLQGCVGEAIVAAARMQRIVADMKSSLRSDARGWCADIQKVLDVAVRMTSNDVRQRARLLTDFQARGAVQGNATRLEQVFVNLIVNAAQALPEGRSDRNEIWLRTRVDADGGVIVEVSDNGPGIPQELQRRIFEPFFTTKGDQGTGLGLAICETIVREVGGDIAIESRPGEGATFRLRLERATSEPTRTSEQPAFQVPLGAGDDPFLAPGSEHVG